VFGVVDDDLDLEPPSPLGVWGGSAIIVSFLWGVIAFGNGIESVLGAGGALVLLTLGVLGIAFSNDLANWLLNTETADKDHSHPNPNPNPN